MIYVALLGIALLGVVAVALSDRRRANPLRDFILSETNED
jgi:hypothetical protein